MANIYDIAKISAGDPQARVADRAKEASALLEQYKHQKEIIDEINAAIKDAENKAKKGKFGASVLGGLLGMGLTAGLAGPLGATLAGGLGAGAGAGIAEKFRQKKYAPTKKLKELEKKLKGRKQYKDVAETRKSFQKGLDQMVLGDVMSSALLGAITPGGIKKEEAVVKQTGPQMGDIPSGGSPVLADPSALQDELKNMIAGEPSKGVKVWDTVGSDFPRMDVPGVDLSFDEATKLFGKDISIKDASKLQQNSKDLIEQIFGFEMGDEAIQMLNKPLVSGLLRSLGPAAYGEFTGLTPYASSYSYPQFRNPYGGY
tara:strand:+ start:831 stop:1775 length:945 start_codon:yes stop_codon:yes gene_type:complete